MGTNSCVYESCSHCFVDKILVGAIVSRREEPMLIMGTFEAFCLIAFKLSLGGCFPSRS